MVGDVPFPEKGFMSRGVGLVNECPVILSEQLSYKTKNMNIGPTYTIVFSPNFFIAERWCACGKELRYMPLITSANLSGKSGSFSKDEPRSWVLSVRSELGLVKALQS